MKDYYYILGLKPNATTEEIKRAYRKLSVKFHPDKNDGDEFFTDRFREILEAYEVLADSSKRKKYDELKHTETTQNKTSAGTNFSPYIEYFKSDKSFFEFNEEVTFSWKTINTNKVTLRPFGIVQPIGSKTYKINDFKNSDLTFTLVAENTTIGQRAESKLKLENKTYKDLYDHFEREIREKETRNNNISNSPPEENRRVTKGPAWYDHIIIVLIILLYVLWLFGSYVKF